MRTIEIVSIVLTALGAVCFSVAFTVFCLLYAKRTAARIGAGLSDGEILKKSQRAALKRERIKNAVKNALFAVVFTAAICMVVCLLITRLAGPVFGKSLMAVASGSMSYQNGANGYLSESGLVDGFDCYDLIVLDRVRSADDLKQYDVIAYRNGNVNIIHRIVAISEADGETIFTTRGDANNADDGYKPRFSDVIGAYRGVRIPKLGAVVLFFGSWQGGVTLAALLYCLIFYEFTADRVERKEKERLGELTARGEGGPSESKS